jgi:hypothetical protein
MTSKDYTIWLKGFAAAAGEFTLTPKQWDDLKEQLNNVDDTPYVSDNFTIGPDGAYERDPNQFPFGTPNGTRGPETPTGTGIRVTTIPGTTVTYTTDGAPNWYTTTVAKEKTLLND